MSEACVCKHEEVDLLGQTLDVDVALTRIAGRWLTSGI
jgi:hypothetical protein